MTGYSRLHGFAAVILLGLLAACQSPQAPRFDPRASKASTNAALTSLAGTNRLNSDWLTLPNDPFTLGPGDRLEIEIFDDPAGPRNVRDPLTRATTVVGPDGKIYFYLLPGVDVWGLTLAEAKASIERELAKLDKSGPQVGITLRAVESRRIWLLGRFQSAGVYPIPSPMTLLEAIAVAGGTLSVPGSSEELADLRRGFVVRQGQLVPVDFDRLLREGDLSQNIYLRPDDFVYVPSAASESVYVLGAVRLPKPIGYSGQPTVVSAIANAGGTIKNAYLSHVAIVRGSLAEPKIAVVDYKEIVSGKAPDVRLEPRDILYVPFTPYRTLSKYADLILTTFVRAVAINEGIRASSNEAVPVGVNIGLGPR
jgi:polysaccharide biosynthesis/export protein